MIKGFRQQHEFLERVIGTDINSRNMIADSSFCDAFYTVPTAAVAPAFVSTLMEICLKEKVNLLIPIIDPEPLMLSERKENFQQIGVQVLVSSPDTVRICNDKYATFQFFKHHNIPTPKTWLAEKITDSVCGAECSIYE